MDIFEQLKKDHASVKKLCVEILKENDFDKLSKLFQEIETEIVNHTKIEEKHLYPEFKNHDETKLMFYEASEEHHLVDELLNRIKKLKSDEIAQWKALFKIMSENLNLHIEEEEKDLFEKAKKIISADRLKEIQVKVEKEKNKN